MKDPFFDSLRREVAMLASNAETQIRSVSPGLSFAELQLQDIDHMLEVMLGERGRTAMSPGQIGACQRLDRTLKRIVREEPGTSPFWTNDGVRSHPKWAAIRSVAKETLDELSRGPPSP